MSKQIIKLNDKTEIDLAKLIDGRLLVQANSGGGKSWLLRRILEQSHGKVQQIIIDLEGEFSTLREKYDYILCGKGGDVPAEAKSAALLARKILEMNVSAIIDLYELPHYERKHFVKLFLEAMVNAPKELWHSCLVVIDEAHIFAPEKGKSEAMEAVIDLATRGRKRGYCVILATQRLSKLHKDAAAECNNKLVGRTGLDIDMKRASEELGFTSKEQYLSLRSINPGEFYAYGSAISREVIKVKVGSVKTTHPKAGSRFLTKTIPPTQKIKNVLKKLTDLPQEAEKELRTILDFKKEVTDLRRKLTVATQNKTVSPEIIKKSVDQALRSQQIEFNKRESVILKNQQVLQTLVSNFIKGASRAFEIKLPSIKIIEHKILLPPDVHPSKIIKSVPVEQINTGEEIKLIGGALRMLGVLVSRYPLKLTKPQLGTFSKMKPRGGSFSTYLSTLRTAGLIISEGNLLSATQKGIDYLGETPNPPQTSEEVINMWKQNLTGGARRMFDVLVEAYPNGYMKETLGELADVVHTGGSFSTYLSILRSNNLIENSGAEIKIADHLFNL